MKSYRIKCELNIRGNDWGVSLGAGRIVAADEDLGDGQTLASLTENGSIGPDHYEALEPPVDAAPNADVEDEG